MSKDNEMNYEDFNDIKSNIIEKFDNMIDKESFKKIMEINKIEKDYENKIDELANEYFLDIPNKNIFGYYKILEHCLKKIKENDKNLFIGFGNSLEIKKE